MLVEYEYVTGGDDCLVMRHRFILGRAGEGSTQKTAGGRGRHCPSLCTIIMLATFFTRFSNCFTFLCVEGLL